MDSHVDKSKQQYELEYLRQFVDLCDLLSNRNRARLIFEIANRERNVGDLAELVGLSQSATSQHLKILRLADAVKVRRDAQNVYFSISSEPLKRMVAYAKSTACSDYERHD